MAENIATEAVLALPVLETIGRIDFSCIPDGHQARPSFTVSVEHRGLGRYAVVNRGACADAAGVFSYESMPSHRADEWVAEHRFDLATARTLAARLAGEVVSMGRTAADVLRDFPMAEE